MKNRFPRHSARTVGSPTHPSPPTPTAQVLAYILMTTRNTHNRHLPLILSMQEMVQTIALEWEAEEYISTTEQVYKPLFH